MLRKIPDAQPASVPIKRTERQVFRRVFQRRAMSSFPGGLSIGKIDDRAILKKKITSETYESLAMKLGCTGAKIGKCAVGEKK